MHQSHGGMNDRGGVFEPHHNQSARPSSQAQQASQAGPSLSRPSYTNAAPPSQPGHVQQQQHQSAASLQHGHSMSTATLPHSQGHGLSHPQHPSQLQVSYGVPVHPREYEQQPPPLANPGPRSIIQHQHAAPSGPGGNKRANASTKREDREGAGPVPPAPSRGTATKGGGGAKRGGQEKQVGSGGGGKNAGGGAAAEKSAVIVNAISDEPIQESKKIRKRKEVVDRIHKVHWDTMENREM